MAVVTVLRARDAEPVARLLNMPEITALIDGLEVTRWRGRPGYPIRALLGVALVKTQYALPTWTHTVALVYEHAAWRAAIGCADADAPSVYACCRFAANYATTGRRWTGASPRYSTR